MVKASQLPKDVQKAISDRMDINENEVAGNSEEDLYKLAIDCKELSDEDLRYRCEVAIRNYDPCISCSTHFLNLERKMV
jgi:coenzyme F420-reducing hydrogenase alpha subunit